MNTSSVYEMESPAVHMIDIENVCGTGKPTWQMVADARRKYLQRVSIQKGDRVFVTAGPQNREAVYEGWPGAIYRFKAGADGADILIAQYICENELNRRYKRAFLASGDGELAPYVETLCRLGLRTTVVALARSTSDRLAKFRRICLDTEGRN